LSRRNIESRVTATHGAERLFSQDVGGTGTVIEQSPRRFAMTLGTILLIILILLLVGALPTWPYSSGWGYYPSGGFGLVLVILLILVAMGRV
jgi:hypothetical protein